MSLIRELQRRNVIRVGAAYLAFSWLLIQIVDTIGADFGFPEGSVRIATIILGIAFLPVMAFTWAFEWTAEGIKRDEEVDSSSGLRMGSARRLDRAVIVLLALATSYFAYDKFVEFNRVELSIAVLPFDDMSQGGDQEWFADGISEELLNLLARVDRLRVTSRSSSFAYRDENLSVPEIAARLGVTYVLEGSVRKAGDTIRITAQLIEAESDAHVWSETYDREFENVFAIQDEISTQVVDQLKVTILGDLPLVDVTSEEAYVLYLEGLSLLARRDNDGLLRAEEVFKQVIELDPEYAPAYAGYAATLFWQGSAYEQADEIIAAAQRALDINPRNADALAILGRKYDDTGRPIEGERLLRRAIEINPSHANAWRWLGTLHADSDPEAYLRYSQRAFELNPTELTIRFHTGLALALLGRYDAAKSEFKLLAESGPGPLQTALGMAASTDFMAGRLDRNLKMQIMGYRDFDTAPGIVRTLAWLGELDLAEVWLDRLRDLYGPDAQGVIYGTAFLRFNRGDKDGALRFFIDASERGHLFPGFPHAGVVSLVMGGDLDVAIADFERVLLKPGQDEFVYHGYDWVEPLYYGIALYRRGDVERAGPLLDKVEDQLKTLLERGVVVTENGEFRLYESLAHLYATRGDHDEALRALRQGLSESYLCPRCVITDSFFDPLREKPEFQQILADVGRWAAEQRDRLAAEGLLLTPEEVLALESFEFDPFGP